MPLIYRNPYHEFKSFLKQLEFLQKKYSQPFLEMNYQYN